MPTTSDNLRLAMARDLNAARDATVLCRPADQHHFQAAINSWLEFAPTVDTPIAWRAALAHGVEILRGATRAIERNHVESR